MGAIDMNQDFSMNIDLESEHHVNVFIIKTWCYEGNLLYWSQFKYICDYLNSPIVMALVRERVGNGFVGAIDISRVNVFGT
jgi:hypothetical protein